VRGNCVMVVSSEGILQRCAFIGMRPHGSTERISLAVLLSGLGPARLAHRLPAKQVVKDHALWAISERQGQTKGW
jgi:hypothetical protein